MPISGGWCPSGFDPADSHGEEKCGNGKPFGKRFTRIDGLLHARRDGQDLKKET
jgi:hypothetical protein